jgi:hypothetical protein
MNMIEFVTMRAPFFTLLFLIQAAFVVLPPNACASFSWQQFKSDLYGELHREKPQTFKSYEAPEKDYCALAKEYNANWRPYYMQAWEGHPEIYNTFLIDEPCTPNKVKDFLASRHLRGDSRVNVLENFVVHDYVMSGFEYINRYAGDPKIGSRSKFVSLMDSGLSKLPNYRGVVYEGNRNPGLWRLRKGQTIFFHGYLSTSLELKMPKVFAGYNNDGSQRGVVFKIHVKNGKDISHIYNPTEQEVLLPRGSKFRVIGPITEDGIKMIELEQI